MKKPLSVIPSRQQLLWGLIYLPADLLVLPVFLALGAGLLQNFIPFSITQGQINGIYFAVNFLVLVLIFRKFLLQELRRCKGRMAIIFTVSGTGFLIYMIANVLLSRLILLADPAFSNVNDAAITQMASHDYCIIALGTTLLVPIAEELLFRGVLFAGIYNRNPLAAYFVSALVFSAVHVVGYIGQYPPLTLLLCLVQYITPSLCLCWAYAKSNSFVTPVIIHTVVNTIGVLSMR